MAVSGDQLKQFAAMAVSAAQLVQQHVNDYVAANPGGGGGGTARPPKLWGWRLGEFSMRREKAGAYPFANFAETAGYQQSAPSFLKDPIVLNDDGEMIGGGANEGANVITVFSHTERGIPKGNYRFHWSHLPANVPNPVVVEYNQNPYYDIPSPYVYTHGIFRGDVGKLYLLPEGSVPPVSGLAMKPSARNRLAPAGILRIDEWLQSSKPGYKNGKNYVLSTEDGGVMVHKVFAPDKLNTLLDEIGTDPDLWIPLHYQMDAMDAARYANAIKDRKCLVYVEATHEPWNIQDVKNGWVYWQAQKLKSLDMNLRPILGDRLKLVASVSSLADPAVVKSACSANQVTPDYMAFQSYLQSPPLAIAAESQIRAWGDEYFAQGFANELAWNYKNQTQQMVNDIAATGCKPAVYSAGILASTTGYNSANPSLQWWLMQRLNSTPISIVFRDQLDVLAQYKMPVVIGKDCEWSIVGHTQQELDSWSPRMNVAVARMR